MAEKRRRNAVPGGIMGNVATKPKVRELPERRSHSSVEPQKGPVSEQRAKVDHRAEGAVSLVAVAGFLMVAVLALSVLVSNIQLTDLHADTVAAQRQLTALEEQGAKLKAEYEEIFDTATLQKAADKAGLQEPTANQKVYMELSDPDNAIVYQHEEEQTGWRGCVQAVKSFFTGIGTYFN